MPKVKFRPTQRELRCQQEEEHNDSQRNLFHQQKQNHLVCFSKTAWILESERVIKFASTLASSIFSPRTLSLKRMTLKGRWSAPPQRFGGRPRSSLGVLSHLRPPLLTPNRPQASLTSAGAVCKQGTKEEIGPLVITCQGLF